MLVAPYQVPFAKEDIILIPLSTPKTGQFVKLLSKLTYLNDMCERGRGASHCADSLVQNGLSAE